MDYRSFFISKNVEIQDGLTNGEIGCAEDLYGIFFPPEYRRMLEQVVPVCRGFYNWRDYSESNVELIKNMLAWPYDSIRKEIKYIDWHPQWGDPPKERRDQQSIILQKLEKAPRMIPVYAHRYIPMLEEDELPVFSIYGADSICYGSDLDEYLEIEFREKQQNHINWPQVKHIPFWSEVI